MCETHPGSLGDLVVSGKTAGVQKEASMGLGTRRSQLVETDLLCRGPGVTLAWRGARWPKGCGGFCKAAWAVFGVSGPGLLRRLSWGCPVSDL